MTSRNHHRRLGELPRGFLSCGFGKEGKGYIGGGKRKEERMGGEEGRGRERGKVNHLTRKFHDFSVTSL